MRKSRNMFYVVTLSTRPGEAQGWEGAQLLFKAKGGCSHVAVRSFFCPDLPLLSDRRARGTSKHRWQALRQRGARCAQKAPCLHGARPPACQAGGHVLVQVYVQGTCCIPSPNPFFSGTYDGRDGSSALLQLLQVQRLLRRGVQPGLAGGVEQAGPGGQQPEHKTGVTEAMPRTSSTSDRSPTSHTAPLRAAELGRPQAPEHTVHLGSQLCNPLPGPRAVQVATNVPQIAGVTLRLGEGLLSREPQSTGCLQPRGGACHPHLGGLPVPQLLLVFQGPWGPTLRRRAAAPSELQSAGSFAVG